MKVVSHRKSHYTWVVPWAIFMEQNLTFGLVIGMLTILKTAWPKGLSFTNYVCNKCSYTQNPNVSTTPIKAIWCQQCLPLSVVQMKGKHCLKPHCHNGVVDNEVYILFWPSMNGGSETHASLSHSGGVLRQYLILWKKNISYVIFGNNMICFFFDKKKRPKMFHDGKLIFWSFATFLV